LTLVFRQNGWFLDYGMGMVPVTFSEVLAWQILSGEVLEYWQVHALVQMSIEYVNERSQGRDQAPRPAPWPERAAADHVSSRLLTGLQALAANRGSA
jgi:hypothetical protein